MIGKRFGRWLVIEDSDPYKTLSGYVTAKRYTCQCDCGNRKVVREDTLENGQSQSCGCLRAEMASLRQKTHGMASTRMYRIWYDMNRRCADSSRKDFKHYGGRGITVCDEWRIGGAGALERFVADMEEGYEDTLELDRIDTEKGYSKNNCKWSTRREQVINRRPMNDGFDAHWIEFNGERKVISQWAETLNIPSSVIVDRIGKLNWSVEKALTTPLRPKSIRLVMDSQVWKISDIFVSPSFVYNQAKIRHLTVPQCLANMFSGHGVVEVFVGKETYEIPATTDISDCLEDVRFKKGFSDFFKERGWNG
jgi:hypothetical protein